MTEGLFRTSFSPMLNPKGDAFSLDAAQSPSCRLTRLNSGSTQAPESPFCKFSDTLFVRTTSDLSTEAHEDSFGPLDSFSAMDTPVNAAQARMELGVQLESDLARWAAMEVEGRMEMGVPLESDLARWAAMEVEWENMQPLQSDLGQWAAEEVQAEVEEAEFLARHPLVLESDVGIWAQSVVEGEMTCMAMPELESPLARWARVLVEAEEAAALREIEDEFIVENGELQASTFGLAYRHSKRVDDRDYEVPGPAWGSTISGSDEGDGWIKVGERYLPTMLHGMKVVSPKACCSESTISELTEPVTDGPAIMPDGSVVDLDGGLPLFFSHSKELSSGYSAKLIAKEAARVVRYYIQEEEEAEAEWRVVSEEVCSIDPAGIMHGVKALAPACSSSGRAAQLKLFQQKCRSRRPAGAKAADEPVLFADATGRVRLWVEPSLADRREKRVRRKRNSGPKISNTIMIIDANGIIHME